MELVLAVNTALDFTFTDRLNDGWHPNEEVVLCLLGFDAVVQTFFDPTKTLFKGSFCPVGNIITHEDAESFDGLPFLFEAEQSTDLK